MWFNRGILTVALLICLLLILVTSALLFYTTPDNVGNPGDFASIPATLYQSVLMLTGQARADAVNALIQLRTCDGANSSAHHVRRALSNSPN